MDERAESNSAEMDYRQAIPGRYPPANNPYTFPIRHGAVFLFFSHMVLIGNGGSVCRRDPQMVYGYIIPDFWTLWTGEAMGGGGGGVRNPSRIMWLQVSSVVMLDGLGNHPTKDKCRSTLSANNCLLLFV